MLEEKDGCVCILHDAYRGDAVGWVLQVECGLMGNFRCHPHPCGEPSGPGIAFAFQGTEKWLGKMFYLP